MVEDATAETEPADVEDRRSSVLIVDDHPLIGRAFQEMINAEPDLEVCGIATDALEALECFSKQTPDLVVLDISLEESRAFELIGDLCKIDKSARILVVSVFEEALLAERALRMGATGYINKRSAEADVLEAMHQVRDGKLYLSEDVKDAILRRLTQGPPSELSGSIESLSARELLVFELVGRGQTTREIADKLQLSTKTIDSFYEKTKAKLGIANRTSMIFHATRWVLENG